MVRLLALALVLAPAACSRADAPPDRVPTPKPDPTPTPPGPYPTRDDQPLVLLQLHDGTSGDAEFAFVELNADPKLAPRVHPLGKKSVYGNPARRYFQAIASYDERRWARIASPHTVVVEAADTSGASGGKSSYTISLGSVEPRAIHLVGDALYVGTDKSVCWVDLAMSAPDAPCVELVARTQASKSYDVFVHRGDRLAAIDDEVMPMYADWFALDARGKPTKRLGDWTLPGTVNGHYPHAALHADMLYLVSPFSVLSGDGQAVVSIPIRDDKLVFEHDMTVQNPGITRAAMEVTDRRGRGMPPIVLAGATMTPWTALAIVPDAGRVLLAAGARGILSLGVDLRGKADAFDLGGAVPDVIARGDRVLALAGTQLVTLDPTTLAVLSRTPLPAAFDRFVR